MDRSRNYINEVDETFTGTPQEVQGISSFADANKIRGVKEYLQSRLNKGKTEPINYGAPGAADALGAEGLMAPDVATTQDSYLPGTKFQLKKAQQEEIERRNRENETLAERRHREGLAQRELESQRNSEDRRLGYSIAAAGRNDARDAKETAKQQKLRTERLQDEAALYGVDDSLDKLNRGIEELKKHPGFEGMIGKSSITGHIPYTDAADARAKLQTNQEQSLDGRHVCYALRKDRCNGAGSDH